MPPESFLVLGRPTCPACLTPIEEDAVYNAASEFVHPECHVEPPAPSWTESIAYTPTVNPAKPWRYACPTCDAPDGFARVESLKAALELARSHRCGGGAQVAS